MRLSINGSSSLKIQIIDYVNISRKKFKLSSPINSLSIVNTKNKYIKKYYRPLPLLDQNVYLGYVRDAINDNDPALNIQWKLPVVSISPKDLIHPLINTNFKL